MKIKRKIEISVISDVHLGSENSHAKHLLTYLNSIETKKLILNGDFVNEWQFNKCNFPKSHLKVIKKIMNMASDGVEVIYITGNHDEMLRKFSGSTLGNIAIVDKLVLNLNGKKAWFFHGDVLDTATKNTQWLTKLGDFGYKCLNLINRLLNWYRVQRGKERYSLSEKIKNSINGTVKKLHKFEKTVSNLAIENGYDYVICGHSHKPKKVHFETKRGKTIYLNSRDWVENFTALEYQFKRWKVHYFKKDKLVPFYTDEAFEKMEIRDLIAAITIVEQQSKKAK